MFANMMFMLHEVEPYLPLKIPRDGSLATFIALLEYISLPSRCHPSRCFIHNEVLIPSFACPSLSCDLTFYHGLLALESHFRCLVAMGLSS